MIELKALLTSRLGYNIKDKIKAVKQRAEKHFEDELSGEPLYSDVVIEEMVNFAIKEMINGAL